MARKFSELVAKMPIEARERAESETRRLIAEYSLEDLRESSDPTPDSADDNAENPA